MNVRWAMRPLDYPPWVCAKPRRCWAPAGLVQPPDDPALEIGIEGIVAHAQQPGSRYAQQSLPFQETTDAMCNGLGQVGDLGVRRRLHPAKTDRFIRTLDIYLIEEQHVEMDIEVQCRHKPLDQRNRTRLRDLAGETGLF